MTCLANEARTIAVHAHAPPAATDRSAARPEPQASAAASCVFDTQPKERKLRRETLVSFCSVARPGPSRRRAPRPFLALHAQETYDRRLGPQTFPPAATAAPGHPITGGSVVQSAIERGATR